MNWTKILGAGLLLVSLSARADEPGREQTQAQLETAREQLRQAAERVAELSRELGGTAFSYVFTSDDDRARLGLVLHPAGEGLEVISVVPDSGAAKAGIEAGAVIVAANGMALEAGAGGTAKLPANLRDLKPGEEVMLKLLSDGETREVAVVAQAAPAASWFPAVADWNIEEIELPQIEMQVAQSLKGLAELEGLDNLDIATWHWPLLDRRWSELELVNLSPELGSYFGTESGILVVSAPEQNLLDLQPGDVIVQIGKREPNNAGHAFRILRSYGAGETITVSLLRHGEEMTLEYTVKEDEAGN